MPDVAPIALRDQAVALAPLQGISPLAEAPRQQQAVHQIRDARYAEESHRSASSRHAGGAVTLDEIILHAGRPAAPMIVEDERPDAPRALRYRGSSRRRRAKGDRSGDGPDGVGENLDRFA
ncbi:MAG: hypothetical protein HY608_00365 [Planctomycetes bacterium]|nr:hypothetical protein [Planctomycetota bacterium]